MRQLKMSAKAGGALLSALLLLAASFTAHSQALEEITVTARKTSENLQEVPLAITALGAEQIDRLGVKDLNSLSQQDTSVQFDEGFTPSDTRITIRGLSPTRGRPNAATLIDGIDISSEAVSNAGGSLLIDPRLIDVQRIEIVKGPQSALYGRSAFAGAISYVTKDPADVLSGGAYLDYGSEGDEEVRGNISIPLTETLGMRINGLAWKKEGYYRNAATGNKLGDGDGTGATVTFKWEPTDNFSAKWRTDYSDDNFGVAAQTLLNDFNTLYDLSNNGGLSGTDSEGRSVVNLATAASNCNGGFRSDYNCESPRPNNTAPDPVGPVFPGDPTYSPTIGYGRNGGKYLDIILRQKEAANDPTVGLYDSSDDWIRNIYNQNVVSAFTGKFPDGDQLQPSIQPDYRLSDNPYDATDFKGTERQVFRNSLVMTWDINDAMVFTSYTGFTDAKENTATDIGKYYRDNCRPGTDQLGLPPEYRAQNDCTGGDGLHDGPISFFQDSFGTTTQLSQEIRLAWDITDNLQFTQGLQYWRERVTSTQFNSTTLVGGPVCYTGLSEGEDLVDAPGADIFFGITPNQN
ncbi:MAG: TonB-dependent receptor plug domain-containing protein, partial [Gammaproteobacteria bacterium]|nr:TonB-dependent receptor plug domain-containing protein [Gammaproteobacteria bacterium]